MATWVRVKNFFGVGDVVEDSCRPFSLNAAATTNATLVKNSAGAITFIVATNVSAGMKFLKLYDTNQVPVAGTGVPVARIPIPAVATTGAGIVLSLAVPLKFATGIAFTITGAAADNDTTVLAANDVTLTLGII